MDLVPDGDSPSSCSDPGTTDITFDFPGVNPSSGWHAPFLQYESGLFLAQMQHTDEADPDKSWTLRFGQGGNIYSHHTDLFGEAIPPQTHDQAPWVDEVVQTVSVNQELNYNPTACFIHQAGTYQKDAPYTDTPFFSPNVAKHCSGNSCTFASWGQQAHVPTTFKSSVLFIHRYKDCGNGVVEYTQTLQNFAPSGSVGSEVNQNYFNFPWGGVRPSILPVAIEPDPSDGTFEIANPDLVDGIVPIHAWGSNEEVAAIKNMKELGGYTTFASGLYATPPEPEASPMPCSNPDPGCASDPINCMVDSCTDDQVSSGYTRVELVVPSGGPRCAFHSNSNGKVGLSCRLRETTNFGRNYGTSGTFAFTNTNTGESLKVIHIRHYTWPFTDRVYFTVDHPNTDEGQLAAIAEVNDLFSAGDGIAVTTPFPDPPPSSDYDSSQETSLTYVYGKGDEYGSGGTVGGQGRRRLGASQRDFTVFTLNHYGGGATIGAQETYLNRQYIFSSRLGDVKATADALLDETHMSETMSNEYTTRSIDLYSHASGESGIVFGAAAADAQGGKSTTCSQGTVACSGQSTPGVGLHPFFYTTCGTATYFGPDLYWFSPGYDRLTGSFDDDVTVRAYACDGEDESVRPSWSLVGYFDPNDAGCASLVGSENTYETAFCERNGPSNAPSISPSAAPSVNVFSLSPTFSPSASSSAAPSLENSAVPSSIITSVPTAAPSLAPTIAPSASPTVTPVTTFSPTTSGDNVSYLSCGNPGGNRCGGQVSTVALHSETHPFRCCADRRIGNGWIKNNGCDVWAESLQPCEAATHHQASERCEEVGARLCSRDEYEDKCTRGTGCQYDRELNWSSTSPDFSQFTRLTFDDFEAPNRWGNFIDGGNHAWLYTRPTERGGNDDWRNGTGSARLRNKQGDDSSIFTKDLLSQASSFGEIKVKFWAYVFSFERDEDFFLEYTLDGTNWIIAAQYINNVNVANDEPKDFEVVLSDNRGAPLDLATASIFQIRFRCDASGNGDVVYIDDVEILGRAI